jgi:hypothetical protein
MAMGVRVEDEAPDVVVAVVTESGKEALSSSPGSVAVNAAPASSTTSAKA